MLSRFLSLVGVAVALAVATPVHATCAHVPGDFSTIQGALDSGTDTVRVADGVYAEDLMIAHDVRLLTEPAGYPPGQPPFPEVGSLVVTSAVGGTVEVRAFHFRGAVRIEANSPTGRIAFDACRMDAGLSTAGIGGCCTRIEVRGCLIFGGAVIDHPSYYDFTCNTVVGGGLVAGAEETAAIRGNYIVGPAAAGIWLRPSDADIFEIEDNVVSGTSEGIVVDGSNHLYGDFHHNTVTDCAGSGFRVFAPGPTNAPKIRHNVVRRCGGHGFDFSNVIAMPDSNDVEDVALDGIRVSGPYAAARIVGNHIVRAGSAGIRLDAQTQAWSPLSGNVVLASGSDGMVIPGGATLDHNVVGRCAGAGVRMTAGSQAQALRYNTVYLNHGTGFDVTGTGAPVTVDHNIAFENDGAGFRWSGSGSPDLACNDWYGNGGGATVGVPPGATDLALLPMFCDVDADSVALASDSPLADAPGCDLIGALPVGCGALSAVAPSSGARESAFAAWPQPGRGTIHLSWRDLGGPGLLEIFDLAGRRCLRTGIAPGATGLDWSGADPGGRRLPAGVYLARLVGAGRALHLRIVIAG